MAMIKCPECSKDVSDSAFKCPSCGVALRKPRRGFMGKLFKWSFIAFNLLMALWFITGMNNASQGMSGLSGAEQAGLPLAPDRRNAHPQYLGNWRHHFGPVCPLHTPKTS